MKKTKVNPVYLAVNIQLDMPDIKRDYFMDSHMEHENLTVHKFTDVDTSFDCDYIVTKGQ